MSTALFIGRFQPFHNAHLEVIKDILKKHDGIIIAIGSSQEKRTAENPFSFKERKDMINAVMKANKISAYKIVAIPDVYNDLKWVALIEKKVKRFDILYTGNPWTIRCFRRYGKQVRRIRLIKGINSTIIRNKMKAGKVWKHLVPKEVYGHINQKYIY